MSRCPRERLINGEVLRVAPENGRSLGPNEMVDEAVCASRTMPYRHGKLLAWPELVLSVRGQRLCAETTTTTRTVVISLPTPIRVRVG
jgi:hypothetical protein